jgi:hypothetical protein
MPGINGTQGGCVRQVVQEDPHGYVGWMGAAIWPRPSTIRRRERLLEDELYLDMCMPWEAREDQLREAAWPSDLLVETRARLARRMESEQSYSSDVDGRLLHSASRPVAT